MSMTPDLPPETADPTLWGMARTFLRDPAVWGSITAVILLRLPLLRGVVYFVVGVATANFLEPLVADQVGKPGKTAIYLAALFGLAIVEKLLAVITNVDPKAASGEAWAAFLDRIRGRKEGS